MGSMVAHLSEVLPSDGGELDRGKSYEEAGGQA